jgi:two-component system invasion response regulator UvrY
MTGISSAVTVILVDSEHLVRAALVKLCQDAPGITVVGEAASVEQALPLIRSIRPSVVLLEVYLGSFGGLEVARRLTKTHPEIGVLVVTGQRDGPWPARLLTAGVRGYVTKGCQPQELYAALRTVHEGEAYFSADVAAAIARNLIAHGDRSPLDALSPREFQITQMVAQGLTMQEIAESLNVSPKTVATTRYRAYQKVGVKNDVQLALTAIRGGIVKIDF